MTVAVFVRVGGLVSSPDGRWKVSGVGGEDVRGVVHRRAEM